MNIERGNFNTLLVPARERDAFYLLVFHSQEAGYQYCVSTNSGSRNGPLMLEFEEKDEATAVDGEVTLGAGDWDLTIYGQASSTNLDASLSTRTVWTEQVHVDSDDVDPATYPPNGGGSGSAPDRGRCRYPRVCGEPEDGNVITWDATAGVWVPSENSAATLITRIIALEAQLNGYTLGDPDTEGRISIIKPGVDLLLLTEES